MVLGIRRRYTDWRTSDRLISERWIAITTEATMWRAGLITLGVGIGAVLAVHTVLAQNQPTPHPAGQPMHQGSMHEMHMQPAGAPRMPGQDAFGAVAEVVRMLDADPRTDWSKVDLERLRQHLIDMNEVVLRSQVTQTPVPGGLTMDITGSGRTEQAIRSMVVPHATELDRLPSLAARAEVIPGGVRLTVTSRTAGDEKAVARLRGLGFIGLLTVGGHHGPHHLAMARGEALTHAH
jgi:hypothetical protein